MGIVDRIFKYIESSNLNASRFEKKAGLSNAYLKRIKGNIGSEKIENILNAFPDINRTWLMTGEGEMLNNTTSDPQLSNNFKPANNFSKYTDEQIEEIIADQFTKHLLEMYEGGRIYPSVLVEKLLSEKDAQLLSANLEIGRLKEEIQNLKQRTVPKPDIPVSDKK